MDGEVEGGKFVATVSRPRSFLRRLHTLVEMRWPIAAYRVISACVFVALGAMIEHAALPTVLVTFFSYFLLSFLVEYGLAETTKEIEQRVNELADEKSRRLITDLETFGDAEKFLTERLRRNTGAVSVLRSGDRAMIAVATGSITKQPAINETLRDLCESLSAVCSKERMISRHEAWFRATYMEVQGDKLKYFGWHTLDGSPPKSMSENIEYRKGEGDAGEAWETGRPFIEDFKDRIHWKENYSHQSSNYKSMICVPVVKGFGKEMSEVIGVITVDTQVELYFGRTGDRAQEEKVARLIRPYGTYIAFISAVDGAVTDLVARLEGNSSGPTLEEKGPLAISAPQSDSAFSGDGN